MEERNEIAAVKQREKELKEEKEAERQVRSTALVLLSANIDRPAAPNPKNQGAKSRQGGKGAVRETGGEDASETG